MHVANLLLRNHGKRNPPGCFRCLVLDLPGFDTAVASAISHNALEDARTLQPYVEQRLRDSAGAMAAEELALLAGT